MQDLNKNVGDEIRRIRQEKGMTQQELGVKVNKSKASVSSLENGRFNSSLNHLAKIADALDRKLTISFDKL